MRVCEYVVWEFVFVCARMCKGVQWCARLCKGVQGFARMCKGVQGWSRMCKGVQGCHRPQSSLLPKMAA